MKDKKYVVFADKTWIQNNKGEAFTIEKHHMLFCLNQNGNKDIPSHVFNPVNNKIYRLQNNQIYKTTDDT